MRKFAITLGVIMMLAGVFGVLYVVLVLPMMTHANPSGLALCATSANNNATTAPSFMTPGTATTTVFCPTDGADQLDLDIVLKASSSAAVGGTELRYRYEYSHNNVDWYIGQEEIVPTEATSTVRVPANFTEYAWKYASSTAEASAGNADTAFKRVQIKDIGSKYFRVKLYLPAGSANGTVYAEIVKKSQI